MICQNRLTETFSPSLSTTYTDLIKTLFFDLILRTSTEIFYTAHCLCTCCNLSMA